MLERDKDYLRDCNQPEWKISDDKFTTEVCTQCVRAECFRSAYRDTATRKKIDHNAKISQYTDPETVPPSPLSVYPDEIIPELAVVETAPTVVAPPVQEPQRPSDPWTAPKDERYIDYREIADPKKDPWSSEYEGPRELRVKPGETVVIGGKNRHGPTKNPK